MDALIFDLVSLGFCGFLSCTEKVSVDTAPMEWCWEGQDGKELLGNPGAGLHWQPVIHGLSVQ